MDSTEATQLVRAVLAACPQQKLDEFTPDVWVPAMQHIDFGAAQRALLRVVQQQAFIAPADIVREVRAERRARLETVGTTIYQRITADGNDVHGVLDQQRRLIREAADGEIPGGPDAGLLPLRPVGEALGPAGRAWALPAGASEVAAEETRRETIEAARSVLAERGNREAARTAALRVAADARAARVAEARAELDAKRAAGESAP